MRLMGEMVRKYKDDVLLYAGMGPLEFFRMVAALPWVADAWNGQLAEVIKRPWYTLHKMWAGGDCDDKAVAMACYFEVNQIPWRFVCVGSDIKKPPTHVFCEADFGSGWVPMDATYPDNKAGLRMRNYPLVVVL
jgi:transglutaminase-like putative cysteine protease